MVNLPLTAVRVKRVLDRKRLSRIGGDVTARRVENAVETSHKRLKLNKEEDDGQEERGVVAEFTFIGFCVNWYMEIRLN